MDLLLAKGVPTARLTTTFRAHPEPNCLPYQLFYEGQLVSGLGSAERQLSFASVRCPNPKVPILFVDISTTSTTAPTRTELKPKFAVRCHGTAQ
ncbi:hypothetical protein GCK32_011530 [Trichostrongylus colubriformis]|uniref:Uncharacterized protein n=1 Tax=Trichostrongylus colubriformis TaxID=6319 RepID=A0AAN8IJ23_TRICO